MHHFLRGRLLYVVLGCLAVLLFVWTRAVMRAVPADQSAVSPVVSAEPAAPVEPLHWIPKELQWDELPRVLADQPVLGAALAVVLAGTLGFALAGIGLTIWGIGTGRYRTMWQFPDPALPAWSFGELGRILLLMVVVAMGLPVLAIAAASAGIDVVLTDPHVRLTVSMLVLDAAAILIIAAFAIGKRTSLWQTFGCARRRLWATLATSVRSYVTLFPWLFVVLWITVEVARVVGIKPPVEPIQELIFQENRPAVLGLTALLACLVGPAAEELFFRGVVFSVLHRRLSRAAAIGLSAGAFALLHGNLIGCPSIWLLGCLLAYLYERTGSLTGPLMIHVLHNTLLMSMALMIRRVMELAG